VEDIPRRSRMLGSHSSPHESQHGSISDSEPFIPPLADHSMHRNPQRELELHRPPSFSPPSFIGNTSSSRGQIADLHGEDHETSNRTIEYSSSDYDPRRHSRETPVDSLVTAMNAVFPWNNSPADVPRTTINGGSFIGRNVNHIQHRGEAGE
jgi:hypothetical protein